MNDRELVQQTLRGNRRAYRELVERYRNAVYGLAISFVGDFDLAEDLAQEAFIRGYYRLHGLADGSRFGAWLRTIAANLCRMELRRRRALPIEAPGQSLDALAGPIPPPDEVYERAEAQRQVMAALKRLSWTERETLTLYYLEGQRVAEVSRLLGLSPTAVKGRLHRARQKLRKEVLDMAEKTVSGRKLGTEFADGVDIRTFGDWAMLTDPEMQQTLREIETKDLAVALKGQGEEIRKVEERVWANVSDRVQGIIRNFMEARAFSDAEIQAAQKIVLERIRHVQAQGRIRPPSGGQA